MKNTAPVIAIYSRKSKFTGKGESIGNQIELCREYIRTHFGDDAATCAVVFEDEGFSGGNIHRPAFGQMMARLTQNEFTALVVYRLDRISRNVSDFSNLIERLNRKKIVFVSIREQFDTATPMGRAMMYVSSVFAQLERETIAERIRDNMHELAKTGRWLGGNTPTGYCSENVKSVTVDGRTRKSCKLKLISQEAENVKLIFELFMKSRSLTATEAALMQRHVLTKNRNFFTRFSIKSILQNPVYMEADKDAYEYFQSRNAELFSSEERFDGVHGIMAYNRTGQEKGKATVFKPVNEWIISVGKHPGIIPGNMWVSVQEELECNKTKAFRRPRKNKALLTGLLFCSCGSRMYPKISNRKTADGETIYTYVCKQKERSKKSCCDNRNAGGNTLDLLIMEKIEQLEDEKSDFVKQLEKSNIFHTGNRGQHEKTVGVMKKEKADLEKKVDALIDTLAQAENDYTKGAIVARIDQMTAQIENLSQEIPKRLSLASEQTFDDAEFNRLRQTLSRFKTPMEEMSCEQKKTALSDIVQRVVWDGEYAHVILFGSQEGDAGIFLATKTDLREDSK